MSMGGRLYCHRINRIASGPDNKLGHVIIIIVTIPCSLLQNSETYSSDRLGRLLYATS